MSTSVPQKLSMSLLRFDRDAYPRFRVDASRVAMFEDVIREGGAGAVPPPEVIHDGKGGYTIVEGVHRLLAFRNLGYKAVEVVTIGLPGGLTPTQAAFERAVETASRTSKPLDRAERNAAITGLVTDRSELSDSHIARLVGVSHQTVGRRRADLSNGQDTGEAGAPSAVRRRLHEEQVAKRLFRALEKTSEARGLGFGDWLAGKDRTGERLARVLYEAHGADAVDRAQRYRAWIDEALALLTVAGVE
jgi:ParB-like chromosome segregation protein Spo0J